jgi:hypothetical protein
MRRSKKLKRGFIFIWVAISFAVLNVHAASNNSKIRLDSLLKNSKTLPAKQAITWLHSPNLILILCPGYI